MVSYLGYFSWSFILALIAWPIFSAILTLPILALMYHRYHRVRMLAALGAYVSVLYMLGLVAFTMYPMPDDPQMYCATHHLRPQLNVFRFISDLQMGGLYGLLQLLMNIALFVPFGFMVTRWWRWRWWAVIPAGFLVSMTIEFTQLTGFWGIYPCAYRQFDVNDMMTNTIGTIIGYGIAQAFTALVPVQEVDEDHINTHPGLVHRAVSYAIDWLLMLLVSYPLALTIILLFHRWARPLPDGSFAFLGLTWRIGALDHAMPVFFAIAFAIMQVWIPITHRGQTLGGMFTHMTLETAHRTGWRRTVFYVIRTALLFAMIFANEIQVPNLSFIGLVLVVFWFVLRKRMPWDLVPAQEIEVSPVMESRTEGLPVEGSMNQELLIEDAANKEMPANNGSDSIGSVAHNAAEGSSEENSALTKYSENQ